jgi:dienelactone hydrolase
MNKKFFLLTFLALTGLYYISSVSAQENVSISTVIEEGGTGPFKAIVTGDKSLDGFAIYRPGDMSLFGNTQKLPVILWGNGACYNSSAGFKNFLSEIASYGYIILAIGPYETLIKADQEIMRQPTKSVQLLDALNWITEQNNNTSGFYFNKIDISKVAVMGQSCGGLQALEVSTDPRITTTIVCNSGIFNDAPPAQLPSLPLLKKELLQQLHGPVIYILGGKTDIAYGNGTDDFSRITKIPAVMMNQEVGHGGTYGQPHGGAFAIAATAWLNWQLKGDKKASLMFIGGDCGFCKDPLWKVETKNFNN